MTRARFAALLLAPPSAALAVSLLVAARAQQSFPHEQHAGLFPLCIGCHLGIATGERAEYYPAPESCTACHDGVTEPVIEWDGPAPRASNLRFEHVVHARAIVDEGVAELDCVDCHAQPGAPRMHVEPPIPDRCFACHAHAATEHLLDAACRVCHEPLAASSLPPARVAALPVPESHHQPDFLAALHGRLAVASTETCATCHTREQCTSCHVLVAAGSPIDEIPAVHGRIAVPLPTASYPLPASHLDPAWERRHGQAATPETCGTCHTRESCTTCHAAPLPADIAALPRLADATAPGVVVLRLAPESHASPFFATLHGPLAAARPQSCATCHDRTRFCGACHEPAMAAMTRAAPAQPRMTQRNATLPASSVLHAAAPPPASSVLHAAAPPPASSVLHASAPPPASRTLQIETPPTPPSPPALQIDTTPPPSPRAAQIDTPPPSPRAATSPRSVRGFHPPNYLLRHSAEAYGRRLDCASCHSTQLFCRDCHVSTGRGSTGRLGPGYHDAEPVWLLRHGQAARQTLESCTSCHTQRDCMQCHSQLGAFRVSPHGPNFDARRAQRANPQICRACHLGDPLAR